MFYKLLVIAFFMLNPPGFKEQQLKFDRVKAAFEEKAETVNTLIQSKNGGTGYQLFIRAFKKEEQLEVWIRPKGNSQYSLLTTYSFCTSSGGLGPKRKEGDLQIPEGVYSINHFNPFSTFHLSLGINYPNASDKILSDKKHPGGAIYIHGNCVSIGCIPITDDKIKELYVMAVEVRNHGQSEIPVHIFPARLETGVNEQLANETKADALTSAFWKNLKTVYDDFENTKKLKAVGVNKEGDYILLP